MFPIGRLLCYLNFRFPRIRGDVPSSSSMSAKSLSFSPHTRGCSHQPRSSTVPASVFPAYAGMFPATTSQQRAILGFPRIRGDVPRHATPPKPSRTFSPHTRGCSRDMAIADFENEVFPAYAGMFPRALTSAYCSSGFPRIRGDVPCNSTNGSTPAPFSPHTRGCSLAALWFICPEQVFPAYAGMFPLVPLSLSCAARFPRIRGDVPKAKPPT